MMYGGEFMVSFCSAVDFTEEADDRALQLQQSARHRRVEFGHRGDSVSGQRLRRRLVLAQVRVHPRERLGARNARLPLC